MRGKLQYGTSMSLHRKSEGGIDLLSESIDDFYQSKNYQTYLLLNTSVIEQCEDNTQSDDYEQEAVYNLALIHQHNGNIQTAQNILLSYIQF